MSWKKPVDIEPDSSRLVILVDVKKGGYKFVCYWEGSFHENWEFIPEK